MLTIYLFIFIDAKEGGFSVFGVRCSLFGIRCSQGNASESRNDLTAISHPNGKNLLILILNKLLLIFLFLAKIKDQQKALFEGVGVQVVAELLQAFLVVGFAFPAFEFDDMAVVVEGYYHIHPAFFCYAGFFEIEASSVYDGFEIRQE
jgi:hypothetical protein